MARAPGLVDRQMLIAAGRHSNVQTDQHLSHRERVAQELLAAGLNKMQLSHAECNYLPEIIHPHEHIGGAIYGYSDKGWILMVATDRRAIILDNKLFYVSKDDITYDIVGGVSSGQSVWGAEVTLHSNVDNFTIRTLNRRSAKRFVDYIEQRTLERLNGGRR